MAGCIHAGNVNLPKGNSNGVKESPVIIRRKAKAPIRLEATHPQGAAQKAPRSRIKEKGASPAVVQTELRSTDVDGICGAM